MGDCPRSSQGPARCSNAADHCGRPHPTAAGGESERLRQVNNAVGSRREQTDATYLPGWRPPGRQAPRVPPGRRVANGCDHAAGRRSTGVRTILEGHALSWPLNWHATDRPRRHDCGALRPRDRRRAAGEHPATIGANPPAVRGAQVFLVIQLHAMRTSGGNLPARPVIRQATAAGSVRRRRKATVACRADAGASHVLHPIRLRTGPEPPALRGDSPTSRLVEVAARPINQVSTYRSARQNSDRPALNLRGGAADATSLTRFHTKAKAFSGRQAPADAAKKLDFFWNNSCRPGVSTIPYICDS